KEFPLSWGRMIFLPVAWWYWGILTVIASHCTNASRRSELPTLVFANLSSVRVLLTVGLQSSVFIEPNVDSRVSISGQLGEIFEFGHCKQGRLFCVGLGGAFAFLQAPYFGFGLQALDFGVTTRRESLGVGAGFGFEPLRFGFGLGFNLLHISFRAGFDKLNLA